ncbi:peroxide stress protein YaaA [Alienimonas sp. DA493]|uniref:peroxide stress protein YaaA n=1 Tax=Alienimonas sp. DA493 TaxID=3373605 RepID=UPI003755041D
MLLTLSPSKTLADAAEPPLPDGVEPTEPRLLDRSERLVKRLRKFSKPKLAELMGVSDKLAELNRARFQAWSRPFTAENSVPAVRAFRGDVYDGLAADDWTGEDLAFAQQRVRILSGLYGVLRPLDRIQPYRLEMGTRFPKATKANPATLYEYWGEELSDRLKADLAALDGEPVLLDLASREYAKAVPLPDVRTITPAFKEERDDGPPRVIALFAKQARGAMARWVVKARVTSPDGLPEFDGLGYRYQSDLSQPDAPVFTRRR